MKNKLIKILSVIFSVVVCLTILCSNISLAEDPANNINAAFSWNSDNNITNTTNKVMGTAISVIRTVGLGIAIIMLTYVAIKYMSSSPEGKAEFKKSATAYIVGAVVLFATSGILGIIKNFAVNNVK